MMNKEKNERRPENGASSGEGSPSLSQESPSPATPSTEKTPLSPLKHALCVATIWVFIIGTPLWFYYYMLMLFGWMPIGLMLEYNWRQKYGVYFLSTRFSHWFYTWLTTSWAWEMFVRRCYIGSRTALFLRMVAHFFFIIGGAVFIVWVYFVYFTPPPLDLEQMRVVTGTLEGGKPDNPLAKGKCGDLITLRLPDGHSESFYTYQGDSKAGYLQKKGQEWTIWTEPRDRNPLGHCRNYEHVVQLQQDRQLIWQYDKTRVAKTNRIFFGIAIFLLRISVFFLFLVWLVNRRKNGSESPLSKQQ